jgi:mono/diheme cytochrome c family protein
MSRLGKGLAIGFVVLLLIILCGITFTVGWRPFFGPNARPLTDRKFESTPQRLERGKYLTTGCVYCHSPHDWNAPGTPIQSGMEFSGELEPYTELPGRIVAPNLTPDKETGAGTWTDDMIARSIREGIGHDGRALFPLMPYPNFRELSDEDVASIVVYLRSVPAVHHELPKTEIIFPVKYLIRNVPEPLTSPVPSIDPKAEPQKYAALTTKICGCGDCHTAQERGEDVKGMAYAGGAPFTGPWGRVASANITPDDTGIKGFSAEAFTQAVRNGVVNGQHLSPAMPSMVYSSLNDQDINAIYSYVHNVAPVHHIVDNTLPPTDCKLCRQRHGGGDKN